MIMMKMKIIPTSFSFFSFFVAPLQRPLLDEKFIINMTFARFTRNTTVQPRHSSKDIFRPMLMIIGSIQFAHVYNLPMSAIILGKMVQIICASLNSTHVQSVGHHAPGMFRAWGLRVSNNFIKVKEDQYIKSNTHYLVIYLQVHLIHVIAVIFRTIKLTSPIRSNRSSHKQIS